VGSDSGGNDAPFPAQETNRPHLFRAGGRSSIRLPEEQLFKREERSTRTEIAGALRDAADQVESGSVHLESETASRDVDIPEAPRFEVELERLTDSETGEQRYELEYEIRWTR